MGDWVRVCTTGELLPGEYNVVYDGDTPIAVFNIDGDLYAIEDICTHDGGDSVMTLAEWQQATGLDMHSFVATPDALFTDAGNGDYSLSATSPALDSGETRDDVPTDIAGVARPQGGGFDVGAYERRVDGIFADGFE